MRRSYREVLFWTKILLTESKFQLKWFHITKTFSLVVLHSLVLSMDCKSIWILLHFLACWFCFFSRKRLSQWKENSMFWRNHDSLSPLNDLIGWIPKMPWKFPTWNESTITHQVSLWFFRKLIRKTLMASISECLRDGKTFLKEWKLRNGTDTFHYYIHI